MTTTVFETKRRTVTRRQNVQAPEPAPAAKPETSASPSVVRPIRASLEIVENTDAPVLFDGVAPLHLAKRFAAMIADYNASLR